MAYDLLRCDEYGTAYDMAMDLESLNQRRQILTTEAHVVAEKQLAAVDPSTARFSSSPAMNFSPGLWAWPRAN